MNSEASFDGSAFFAAIPDGGMAGYRWEHEKVKEGAGAVARNSNKLLSSLSEPGLFG